MRTLAVKNHWPGSPPFTMMVSAMFARQRSLLFLFHIALNAQVKSLSANVPSSMKLESFIESFGILNRDLQDPARASTAAARQLTTELRCLAVKALRRRFGVTQHAPSIRQRLRSGDYLGLLCTIDLDLALNTGREWPRAHMMGERRVLGGCAPAAARSRYQQPPTPVRTTRLTSRSEAEDSGWWTGRRAA